MHSSISFTTNPIVSLSKVPINTQQNTCRKYTATLPNLNPTIYSLSQYISAPGLYAVVYIQGNNFSPYNASVNFGYIQNIPIVFYNSFTVSFVVPIYVSEGEYQIQVVNVNNSKWNKEAIYSNIVNYNIQNYSIQGSYNTTDNATYNTILTFTSDSEITFNNKFNVIWNSENGTILTNYTVNNKNITINVPNGPDNVKNNSKYTILFPINEVGSVVLYMNV